MALRSPTMSTPDRWELPGGKVEPGESDTQALIRELREELHITVEVQQLLGCSRFGPIELVAYTARLLDGDPRPAEHAEIRWVAANELHQLRWADADLPLIPLLRDTISAEDLS